jgi:xanthine/uracil permease
LPRHYLFAVQWLIAGLATAVATPVALGPILGLSGPEVAELVQRTLFVSGVATVLQVTFGHRMPIQEGPAGIWIGVILVLAAVAPAAGKSPELLRADLQIGFIAAGAVMAVMGALRLVRHLMQIMTPLVTGVYLLLLCLQVSGPFLRGMAGAGYREGPGLTVFLLSLATLAVVFGCAWFGRGLVRALAVLIGLGAGWALFLLFGAGGIPEPAAAPFVRAPTWFAWGPPVFDPGVLLAATVTALFCFFNLHGAMAAMSAVTGEKPGPVQYDRGGLQMGFIHVLSGTWSTAGIIVLTHSAAIVGLTGHAGVGVLQVAGAGMTALAFFPGVSSLFSALPAPVAYAALFALFAQVAAIAVQSLSREAAEPRALSIIGLSLMAGAGCLLLPVEMLAALPPAGRYLASNGLLVGTSIAIVLQAAWRR